MLKNIYICRLKFTHVVIVKLNVGINPLNPPPAIPVYPIHSILSCLFSHLFTEEMKTLPNWRRQRLPVQSNVGDLAHYAKRRTYIVCLQRIACSGACLRFSAYVPPVCKIMIPDGLNELHSLASRKRGLACAVDMLARALCTPG